MEHTDTLKLKILAWMSETDMLSDMSEEQQMSISDNKIVNMIKNLVSKYEADIAAKEQQIAALQTGQTATLPTDMVSGKPDYKYLKQNGFILSERRHDDGTVTVVTTGGKKYKNLAT